MQPILRSALKYFGLFILLYGAMTAISLIPAVGAAFNAAYRQPTEPILKSLFSKAYLQLKTEQGKPDVIRVEYASKLQVQQQMEEAKLTGKAAASITGRDNLISFYNLFLSFWLFLAALVLLSPISWKEKGIGLLAGTVLFYLYTVLKVYLAQLSLFNQPDIAIYQTGEFWLNTSRSILYFMTLGTNVLVVLLIWALVAFRKGNWRELLKKQ
ncbi:MAG: hypothetical protein H6577_02195 [Lewinellaceae bacterium]|nr:hypothetical protein [Saprospiraceae bacterium]MCB9336919.1 hypothetical protein [Lewinellaceae bacterium]